jgi:ribokinase
MDEARGALAGRGARAARVVVVGSTMVDLISYVDRMPHAGETMHASSVAQAFGGKGANQAVAAAMHGVDVSMVACVGDDVFGPETVANLARLGVDTAHVATIAGEASGTALILVEPSGQNRIVLGAGANRALTEAQVDDAFDAISNDLGGGPDVVVGQLETPQGPTARAFERARALGATTILNPGPAAPLDPRVVAACDWLVPNESELAILLGLAGDHPVADALALAPGLAASLGVGLVVTLGQGGAVVLAGGEVTARVAAPEVRAVDTTGAGDAFVGAFATALAAGCDPVSAAQLAVEFASDSVTRPGTQTSYRAHPGLLARVAAGASDAPRG